MDALQILVLSCVQGLTEFLPISSSGHLILAPLLFGYQLQHLSFDVAVHLGTLLAVVLYFRHDLARIAWSMTFSALPATLSGPVNPEHQTHARLGWLIILATLPLLFLGLPLKLLLEFLREDATLIALVIATTTIGFGALLWFADRRGRRDRDEHSLGWRGALTIGLFQAIAIIPGTSRSGITITAGLFLGLTRQAASRFSFLLSIPTIAMAGALETRELLQSTAPVDWTALFWGALLSFVVAYLTVFLFLRFIERLSMLPFVLYRFVLGGVILFLVLL